MFSKKGHLIEDSIARAYIQQIRNADHYIYIENQYFLGAAYAWYKERDTNARHIVPMEIVSKIIDKIEAGERWTDLSLKYKKSTKTFSQRS